MPTQRQHTDGRVARGERTREAIVAAHTALLREGVLKPTGQAIADRAGVSVRTLWANFKDFEALLKETTATGSRRTPSCRWWSIPASRWLIASRPTMPSSGCADSSTLHRPRGRPLWASRSRRRSSESAAHISGLRRARVTSARDRASGSETLLRAVPRPAGPTGTLRDDSTSSRGSVAVTPRPGSEHPPFPQR